MRLNTLFQFIFLTTALCHQFALIKYLNHVPVIPLKHIYGTCTNSSQLVTYVIDGNFVTGCGYNDIRVIDTGYRSDNKYFMTKHTFKFATHNNNYNIVAYSSQLDHTFNMYDKNTTSKVTDTMDMLSIGHLMSIRHTHSNGVVVSIPTDYKYMAYKAHIIINYLLIAIVVVMLPIMMSLGCVMLNDLLGVLVIGELTPSMMLYTISVLIINILMINKYVL